MAWTPLECVLEAFLCDKPAILSVDGLFKKQGIVLGNQVMGKPLSRKTHAALAEKDSSRESGLLHTLAKKNLETPLMICSEESSKPQCAVPTLWFVWSFLYVGHSPFSSFAILHNNQKCLPDTGVI